MNKLDMICARKKESKAAHAAATMLCICAFVSCSSLTNGDSGQQTTPQEFFLQNHRTDLSRLDLGGVWGATTQYTLYLDHGARSTWFGSNAFARLIRLGDTYDVRNIVSYRGDKCNDGDFIVSMQLPSDTPIALIDDQGRLYSETVSLNQGGTIAPNAEYYDPGFDFTVIDTEGNLPEEENLFVIVGGTEDYAPLKTQVMHISEPTRNGLIEALIECTGEDRISQDTDVFSFSDQRVSGILTTSRYCDDAAGVTEACIYCVVYDNRVFVLHALQSADQPVLFSLNDSVYACFRYGLWGWGAVLVVQLEEEPLYTCIDAWSI